MKSTESPEINPYMHNQLNVIRAHIRVRLYLQQMMLTKLHEQVRRMKFDSYLSPYTKINCKWVKVLNLNPKTEVSGRKCKWNIWKQCCRDYFFEKTPHNTDNKSKTKQLQLHQSKTFLHEQEIINRVKGHSEAWQNLWTTSLTKD